MRVDSKIVQGRRKLNFGSLDDVVADAQMLASSPDTRTLGNWPLDQLIAHLARTIDLSIDGIDARFPLLLRLMGPLIWRRVMRDGLSPGFNLPKNRETMAYPAGLSPSEAVGKLREAVARAKRERMTARHPVFGRLTHDEWLQFHLRHAAMHLSFAVPPPVKATG